MKTLTIRLAAPLQSYGNEATFNLRTSFQYPSKSAVLGMIAAGLGYRREDNQKLQALNKLKYAVRVEQSGHMMTEFQTVEYHKSASRTARKLTYRNFLQDAVFVAAVGSDDDAFINKIEYAIMHPKFQLYLGRRSNPPAGIMKLDSFENKNPVEVLENLDWKAANWFKRKYHNKIFKTTISADAELLPNKKSFAVKDKIGSFNSKNRFHDYRLAAEEIVELSTKVAKEKDGESKADFDIWKFV